MTDYAFFSQEADMWGKGIALLWGSVIIYPHYSSSTHPPHPSRAVLPYQPQGLGRETEDPPQHHLPAGTS